MQEVLNRYIVLYIDDYSIGLRYIHSPSRTINLLYSEIQIYYTSLHIRNMGFNVIIIVD